MDILQNQVTISLTKDRSSSGISVLRLFSIQQYYPKNATGCNHKNKSELYSHSDLFSYVVVCVFIMFMFLKTKGGEFSQHYKKKPGLSLCCWFFFLKWVIWLIDARIWQII